MEKVLFATQLTIKFVINKGKSNLYVRLFFPGTTEQLTLIKMLPEREKEKEIDREAGRESADKQVVYEWKTNFGSKLQVDFMKFICPAKCAQTKHGRAGKTGGGLHRALHALCCVLMHRERSVCAANSAVSCTDFQHI